MHIITPKKNEPIDEEVDIRQLYQIQNNEDYTEPNIYREIHLGIKIQ